jgi:hypothetical protein
MKSLNNTSSLWTNLHVEELEKREEYTGISSISSIHPECCDYSGGNCCDYDCCDFNCVDSCCDFCADTCCDYCTDHACCDYSSGCCNLENASESNGVDLDTVNHTQLTSTDTAANHALTSTSTDAAANHPLTSTSTDTTINVTSSSKVK